MTLAEIERTHYARVADEIVAERPLVAVEVMDRFFGQYYIEGVPANQINSIAGALNQARGNALRGNGINGTSIAQTASLFSQKYEYYLKETNLEDIRQSIKNAGFANFHQDFDSYVDENPKMTYGKLANKAQDNDEDAQKMVPTLNAYEKHKVYEVALPLELEVRRNLLNNQ
jgi:hypothetical protein